MANSTGGNFVSSQKALLPLVFKVTLHFSVASESRTLAVAGISTRNGFLAQSQAMPDNSFRSTLLRGAA